MSDVSLKHVATLTIAEYTDREGIYVKVRFDPITADVLLSEDVPDSYKLMQYVFQTSLADLAKDSMVPLNSNVAPSTDTPQ